MPQALLSNQGTPVPVSISSARKIKPGAQIMQCMHVCALCSGAPYIYPARVNAAFCKAAHADGTATPDAPAAKTRKRRRGPSPESHRALVNESDFRRGPALKVIVSCM